MQIYADVTNREIMVADSNRRRRLGRDVPSRAGEAQGGYDSIIDAAEKMARVKEETFADSGACGSV